jgi:hypothetical protein
MLTWYVLCCIDIYAHYFNWLPAKYTPLIVWATFLIYIFFPSSTYFNPRGRKYFYKLIIQVAVSYFNPITFKVTWATNQVNKYEEF